MKEQRLTDFKAKTNRDKAAKTKHISTLKIAIPIIAILLTAITFIWTFTSNENITAKLTETTLKTIAKNELVNPRFESTDSKNQPYTITAAEALRAQTNEDLIILVKPAGDITLESGRWLSIKASDGTFNQSKNTLNLQNNVQIFDNQGYQMQTAEMDIDMKKETILSSAPVYGQGPAGTIKASGLYSNINQGLLSFKGPATLTLNSKNSSIGGLK